MYCEWYAVCDFVVLSVVEVCVDYGGVNVFHVYLHFCVVYGVKVCVNVCGLFITSGICVLCCDVVYWVCGADFGLLCDACSWIYSIMGSVCVLSYRSCGLVSVVHTVSILSAVFCDLQRGHSGDGCLSSSIF